MKLKKLNMDFVFVYNFLKFLERKNNLQDLFIIYSYFLSILTKIKKWHLVNHTKYWNLVL